MKLYLFGEMLLTVVSTLDTKDDQLLFLPQTSSPSKRYTAAIEKEAPGIAESIRKLSHSTYSIVDLPLSLIRYRYP